MLKLVCIYFVNISFYVGMAIFVKMKDGYKNYIYEDFASHFKFFDLFKERNACTIFTIISYLRTIYPEQVIYEPFP